MVPFVFVCQEFCTIGYLKRNVCIECANINQHRRTYVSGKPSYSSSRMLIVKSKQLTKRLNKENVTALINKQFWYKQVTEANSMQSTPVSDQTSRLSINH